MPQPGDPLPLSMKLYDSNPNMHVRAIIRDSLGVPLPASPVTLSHTGEGRYESSAILMPPNTDKIVVNYQVFDDAGFTIPSSRYTDGSDVFPYEVPSSFIISKLDEILNALALGLGSGGRQAIEGALVQVTSLKGIVSRNDPKEGIVYQNQQIEGQPSPTDAVQGDLVKEQ